MNAEHDLNDCQVIRELAKSISAASKKANEQGQPFILPWRLNPDARLQINDDAGCGCGPID